MRRVLHPVAGRAVVGWVVAVLVLLATGTWAEAQDGTHEGDRPGGDTDTEETAPEPSGPLDTEVQILSVDTTGDEVVVEVAMPPSVGRLAPVDGNFGISDGGQLVDLTVSPVVNSADAILVIDTSGSMEGPPLAAAQSAARRFIETLPEETRVGLVTFGETVVVHRQPTFQRGLAMADIDQIGVADGDTALWEALATAAGLIDSSQEGQASVIVLSDGDNTVDSATQAEAVSQLRSGSAVLYAVAIQSPETEQLPLQETVDSVGGQFLTAADIDELDSLYANIAGRLANRYQLRFTPSRGGERTLVVSAVINGSVIKASTTISGGPVVEPGSGGSGPAEDPGPGLDPAPVLNAEDHRVLGPVAVPTLGLLAQPTMLWIGIGSLVGAIALVGLVITRQPTQVKLASATATGVDRLAGFNARVSQTADRLVTRPNRGRPLDARLDAADVDLRPGEFILLWILGTLATAATLTALGGLLIGLLAVPLSVVLALALLGYRANRRRSRFADQLAETLGIMASSLRAGQSLHQAIELVANETPSPTAEQFNRIHFEIRVGRDLTESMRGVAHRMQSPDLEWLAQAVDIHRELGGDLTEILDNVASTIRERRTVARQVEALSAEGRITGYVLLGMPIVLFLFAWWRNPASIEPMVTDPVGRLLLAIAIGGMALGHLWIRQLVKIKF
jgi:tight adherence protein B